MAQHYSIKDGAMPVCAESVAAIYLDVTGADSDLMATFFSCRETVRNGFLSRPSAISLVYVR